MPKKIEIEVEQDEMLVLANKKGRLVLTTEGVSTCICLLIRGRVGGVPYIGMYHWPGFDESFDRKAPDVRAQAKEEVYGIISRLANMALETMSQYNTDSEPAPQLDYFHIIGGQHAVLTSVDASVGTELEVATLKKYAEDICDACFITFSDTVYRYDNYQTEGRDYLDLSFDTKSLQVKQHSKEEINETPSPGRRFG